IISDMPLRHLRRRLVVGTEAIQWVEDEQAVVARHVGGGNMRVQHGDAGLRNEAQCIGPLLARGGRRGQRGGGRSQKRSPAHGEPPLCVRHATWRTSWNTRKPGNPPRIPVRGGIRWLIVIRDALIYHRRRDPIAAFSYPPRPARHVAVPRRKAREFIAGWTRHRSGR